MTNITSKRFVMRKSLIGQNVTINVNFKNGKTVTYNHDNAYSIMREKLEAMNCWAKYKSYTATNNLPTILRDKEIA